MADKMIIPKLPHALVGFIGKAGAGKTTLANYLLMKYYFKIFSFAHPLKQMLINAGMFNKEDLYGENKSEKARKMLQLVGTEIFREQVDKDFWVKRANEVIPILLKLSDVVIDDVRFPNEAQYISDKGGLLVRIIREDQPILNVNYATHDSETLQEQILADYTIKAKSGDLTKLYMEIEKILSIELLMHIGTGGYHA